MRKTKNDLAERIYKLSQRIKADKDELEELRGALEAKMKPGQAVVFGTPEGIYRLKLCECQETVLKENATIQGIIGTELFVKVAKIGCTALKEGLKLQCGNPLAEETMASCTKAIVTKNTLKLLKGRE